jgi:hypothetical protein
MADARLLRRLVTIAERLQAHPDDTYPEAMGDEAAIEGFYRFVSNESVSWEDILDAHCSHTVEQIGPSEPVLALHDTTQFTFPGEEPRRGMPCNSDGKSVFYGHFALAVSADGSRRPLGVLGFLPLVRIPSGDRKGMWYGDRQFDTETDKWPELVWQVVAGTPNYRCLIHIMDREGDIYDLIAPMSMFGLNLVIRSSSDRILVPLEDGGPDHVSKACLGKPILFEREVKISKRTSKRPKDACRKHPPRKTRMAKLGVQAATVRLRRPPCANPSLPKTTTVNLVQVIEVDAPVGEAPVQWRLYTTLPISTIQEVERIVDYYRARWEIEELFKAIKTGTAYEKRQLESLDTLLVGLALAVPLAVRLMALRWASRMNPDAPAETEFDADEIEVLREAASGPRLDEHPTVIEALYAIARLGGFIRSNGEPGYRILGRGLVRLQDMVVGWRLAHGRAGSEQHRFDELYDLPWAEE